MTTQQHNELSIASDVKIETKQTGSGHWILIGYFTTDNGEVVVKASTTDSQMIDAINDKNEDTDRIKEGVWQAAQWLINRGEIVEQD